MTTQATIEYGSVIRALAGEGRTLDFVLLDPRANADPDEHPKGVQRLLYRCLVDGCGHVLFFEEIAEHVCHVLTIEAVAGGRHDDGRMP